MNTKTYAAPQAAADMAALNARMKAKLEASGIPYKRIECYGSQIVVTSYSSDSAAKWATLLANFAKVRGTIETLDDAVRNRNTVLRPSKVRVWRTFAVIS